MKSKEREQLAIVHALLEHITAGLSKNPIDRGQAIGAALDAKDIVEELVTTKEKSGG